MLIVAAGVLFGFQVTIAVCETFEYLDRWLDVWLGRLQDRVSVRGWPGAKRLPEGFAVRGLSGGEQALPFGQMVFELSVLGSQVLDPLAWLGEALPRSQGELLVLGLGGELGFGGAQGWVALGWVPTVQFGVGGYGQLPLLVGGLLPFDPVGHDGGEDVLAFSVGVAQGLIAGCEGLLLPSSVVLALPVGGFGFGGGPDGG